MHKKKHNQSNGENGQLDLPAFEPRVIIPAIRIPQPDGSWLIKAGKPEIIGEEMGTREAAKFISLSQRRVRALCDEGILKEGEDWRRPGGPNGKILIKKKSLEALSFPKGETTDGHE